MTRQENVKHIVCKMFWGEACRVKSLKTSDLRPLDNLSFVDDCRMIAGTKFVVGVSSHLF